VAFHVYIMASRRNGTLYVGMTDDLDARVAVHRAGEFPGFTRKYGCKTLVWFEAHETREAAFLRERRIKRWNRAWKLALIERDNPDWADLAGDGLEVSPERLRADGQPAAVGLESD
jgi:putative endonuclease